MSLCQQIVDTVRAFRPGGAEIATRLDAPREEVFQLLANLEARGVLRLQRCRLDDRPVCRWIPGNCGAGPRQKSRA